MTPDLFRDPIAGVLRWYDEAVAAGERQADAMALATATPDGRPSVRIVLFKAGSDAVRFFTNLHSRKARELLANPQVAATFHWQIQARQVRVEGRVTRLPDAENDAYFASRPRESQIGAWASQQSEEIASMEQLAAQVREVEARFAGGPVARPPHWGGFRIDADAVEFWEARPFRLHERVLCVRTGDGWVTRRLSP
jgi:pyridoxamine 5'-phosphate oxidase